LLFLEDLGVDWQEGPVSIADLEQLNLTRDDLIHMGTLSVERDEKHAKRFPNGLFTDDLWRALGSARVTIDRDKLAIALGLVMDFCAWLDGIRCEYPRYRKSLDAGEPWSPTTTTPPSLPSK